MEMPMWPRSTFAQHHLWAHANPFHHSHPASPGYKRMCTDTRLETQRPPSHIALQTKNLTEMQVRQENVCIQEPLKRKAEWDK
jgi:hypothetical protein